MVDKASPTGYAGGIRERVLPDHDNHSYEWIAQTQRAQEYGEWRIRRIAEENAPFGRETHAAAPYRWWLATIAWVDRQFDEKAVGLSVERAALYADPVLHLLILVGLTVFAARYAGRYPAIIGMLGGAFLFPFAARFFPGVPDDSVLEAACVFGSLLPLLGGFKALDQIDPAKPTGDGRGAATRWFCAAGVFAGIGLWISPASHVPLVVGVTLGAMGASRFRRQAGKNIRGELPKLWRLWSLSAALTVLFACLIEYYPAHLGAWELRAVHPLYGLAWIGAGELLARIIQWIEGSGISWKLADLVIKFLAILAVLTVPVVMYWAPNPGFLAVDELFFRLTNQPSGVMASNLADWIRDDGFTSVVWSVLLPLVFLLPALGLLIRKQTGPALRAPLVLVMGAVVPLLVVGYFELRQWVLVDASLLVLLIVITQANDQGSTKAWSRWVWNAVVGLILLPGMLQLIPKRNSVAENVLALPQVVGLVERDLAHWLAKTGGASIPPLVLAPPKLTASLNYYGGLRGIGTLSFENNGGLSFAIRIAISTSWDETAALLRQRGVTHIVIPTWDRFFDSYIQQASVQKGELFYQSLTNWKLPLWLRPLPYQLPSIAGFEKQSVAIFELVEDQDAPIAASRLTEYFVEMGELARAKASHQYLLKYPANFGVQVARAQLWAALNDEEKFNGVFEPLLNRLAAGAARYLPWDRRVSLAIVLAKGNRLDLARGEVEHCLADVNETRLRTLTTDSLYRLLVLNRALGFEIADPKLRALALDLVPTTLRQSL